MYSKWAFKPQNNQCCPSNPCKNCNKCCKPSYNNFCPDGGVVVNIGGHAETLVPPFSNMILTSGSNGCMNWVRACDMAGLANPPTSMSSNIGGVVTRIPSLGCDNCLQVLQPSCNQILTSDCNGIMSWTSICSFGGMNNLISNTAPLGSALVINLGSNSPNCLARLAASSPDRVLIVNSLGAIEFATNFPHVLGSHSDTLFTTLLECQTVRYTGGVWRNVSYYPNQFINVTQNAAAPLSYSIVTLCANYDFNINGVASFNIIIPDVDATNDGTFLTIRSSNANGVPLVINTTTFQNIGSYSSYIIRSSGQSITLAPNFATLSWVIIGTNDHIGVPHHVNSYDLNTTAVSTTGSGNAILRWDSTLYADPSSDIVYNSATGELTISRGGVYSFEVERHFRLNFSQLGTVEFDMVLVHASGTGLLLTDPAFSTRIDYQGVAQSFVISVANANEISGLLRLTGTVTIEIPYAVYGFVVRVAASNGAQVINFNPTGTLAPVGSSGSFKVTRLT